MTKEPIDLIYNFLPYADIPKSRMITAEDRVFIGCDITKGNVVTIREQLKHAQEYGYPVVVHDPTFGDGNYYTGTIKSMEKDAFSMQIGDVSRGLLIGEIDEVVVLLIRVDDDNPDSEIAEIDRDERWESGDQPRWVVYGLKCSDTGKLGAYRRVAKFDQEKDAKAAAMLPELVKQRDKLLEASKSASKWMGKHGGPARNDVDAIYTKLYDCIAEIEKNPLIRLVDGE